MGILHKAIENSWICIGRLSSMRVKWSKKQMDNNVTDLSNKSFQVAKWNKLNWIGSLKYD